MFSLYDTDALGILHLRRERCGATKQDTGRHIARQCRPSNPSFHLLVVRIDAVGRTVLAVARNGVFEHHRWGGQSQASANNHVHVMDDRQRIALVRTGNAHPDDRGPAVQFHLADHLGSSNVVVNSVDTLVTREELTPYGETSFGSFAKKRYRFTGKSGTRRGHPNVGRPRTRADLSDSRCTRLVCGLSIVPVSRTKGEFRWKPTLQPPET